LPFLFLRLCSPESFPSGGAPVELSDRPVLSRARLGEFMTLSLAAGAALANGLLIGLIPTVVDGIKPSLKARLDVSETRVSWFSGLFYFTWLLAMPLAGRLIDDWPNRDVLLFGGLVPLILGVAWLALARS